MQYYGINDVRFNADNFGHQPQSLIFDCLRALETERRNEINAHSSTNARGFAGIFSGFGGNKTSPFDLLPYQIQTSDKRLSDKTRRVAKRLKLLNRVPPRIWAIAWSAYPELSDD